MNNIFYVFIGGGLGSIVRYGISEFVRSNFKSVFPVATLISNILSCIILAIAFDYFSNKMELNTTFRMLIIVGFCGGFSTFSTFSYETLELMRTGNTLVAVANVLISVSVCLSLIFLLIKRT